MSWVSWAIFDAPLLGQVMERPHVVEPIRELHQDDADVIHHRQQHLAEVLSLALLAGRERNGADLRDALDDVRDLGAEELGDAFRGRQGVLDDVVQEAGGDRHDVELHVGEEVGHLQRDGPGTARRNGAPGPCARAPRTRTPAAAAPGPLPDCSSALFRGASRIES